MTESLDEVLAQCLDVWILLLKLIDRDSIWNGLDEAASRTRGDNVEWFQPDIEVMRLENCLELLYEL